MGVRVGYMDFSRFSSIGLFLGFATLSFAQATSESVLNRLTTRVDVLLKVDQPPLFAWHLRSVKALALAEYAKLGLGVDQSARQTVAMREKEFIECVGRMADGLDGDAANPDGYLKEGRRALVLARPSAIDGTLQWTMVGLPKGWDPNRAYPLFVNLHGTGPDHPLAYPSFVFLPPSPPSAEPPKYPMPDMISLTPWGRGNRGWRNDAERDMFEAIRQLQTFAKTDPDRWYLTGHAGADGAWAIVQHTPDLWASAGMQSGSMLAGRPEWGLVPNMIHVPMHLLIGAKDNLPNRVPDTKEAYRLLTEAGDEAKLVILPDSGHYPLTDEGVAEHCAWIASHIRKRPDKFSFTVDEANHSGIWGIRVLLDSRGTRLIKEPWPQFEVEIKGDEVRMNTTNVKNLSVDLGPGGLQMTGVVRLWVNGKKVHDGPVPKESVMVKDLR
ncbi:hypothetical protein BH11ARM2_BH11ARM2_00100 [soil metagenome]